MVRMRLFQASDALRLTGLSRPQLREWCGTGRRRLLAPDQEAAGPGRHALFSWRTIMALRVLRTLQTDYGVEIKTWAAAAGTLRARLDRTPYPSLWGRLVWFESPRTAELIGGMHEITREQGLVLPLDPHLAVLASSLSEQPPHQLTLFPARAVG